MHINPQQFAQKNRFILTIPQPGRMPGITVIAPPPSPLAIYKNPSGPNPIQPPLWLLCGWL